MCVKKSSAGVDGGLSGELGVRRPRSKDPHRHHWKFILFYHYYAKYNKFMSDKILVLVNNGSMVYSSYYLSISAHTVLGTRFLFSSSM